MGSLIDGPSFDGGYGRSAVKVARLVSGLSGSAALETAGRSSVVATG